MARDTWYRLDNIGKFYSSQAGSSVQTIFRYSATLVDDVDEAVLQHALEKTVQTFPSFNVSLRSGMFWHYLEQATKIPEVTQENLPICFGLHVDTKSILFRVSYYRNRINFEISHMISDGRGSLIFFKSLLYAYLEERYHIEGLSAAYDGSDYQKSEDSFDKHYERSKAASTHAPKVYRISGWRDVADPTFMEFHVPAGKAVELARSYKVSVTSLIIATIMYSIRTEMSRRDRNRAIHIDVPVDLRGIFDSTTTKNFFGLAFATYLPFEDESVREIAEKVNIQLKVATEAENLKPRMNRMIALEKNPLLRFAPLFIKDLALEFASWLTARGTTTTVSNLGKIEFDKRLVPFVENLNILTSTTGLNLTLCSYEDDLSIGISTVYSNLDIIKNFCRFFSENGIEGYLNINKSSKEVAADLREVNLEKSAKRLSRQQPSSKDSKKPRKASSKKGADR